MRAHDMSAPVAVYERILRGERRWIVIDADVFSRGDVAILRDAERERAILLRITGVEQNVASVEVIPG